MFGTQVTERHKRVFRSRKPVSLFRFLASKGGLKPHGDLAYILDGNPFVPGYGRLIRKTGMTLDRAREACVENSYMIDGGWRTDAISDSTTRALLDMIAEESAGRKQYAIDDEPTAEDEIDHDMSADEYRYILDQLGLTQSGAAKTLGVDARTSRRWACGERNIPEPVARLLRVMLNKGIKPSDVN